MKLAKKKVNTQKQKAFEFDPTKKKIKFKFDMSMLNMFIGYCYCDNKMISKMNLMNLRKLFEVTDMHQYQINVDLYARVQFIQRTLEARLVYGMANRDAIIAYAKEENNKVTDNIVASLDRYSNLNEEEIKFITKSVADRIQYSFIMIHKEIISNLFLRMDTGDYKYIGEIVDEVKDSCVELMNDIRKASQKNANKTFSLDPEVFESMVEETINEAVNPTTVLKTGLRLLNDMLSPGYMAGRLYMYLG